MTGCFYKRTAGAIRLDDSFGRWTMDSFGRWTIDDGRWVLDEGRVWTTSPYGSSDSAIPDEIPDNVREGHF